MSVGWMLIHIDTFTPKGLFLTINKGFFYLLQINQWLEYNKESEFSEIERMFTLTDKVVQISNGIAG